MKHPAQTKRGKEEKTKKMFWCRPSLFTLYSDSVALDQYDFSKNLLAIESEELTSQHKWTIPIPSDRVEKLSFENEPQIVLQYTAVYFTFTISTSH